MYLYEHEHPGQGCCAECIVLCYTLYVLYSLCVYVILYSCVYYFIVSVLSAAFFPPAGEERAGATAAVLVQTEPVLYQPSLKAERTKQQQRQIRSDGNIFISSAHDNLPSQLRV